MKKRIVSFILAALLICTLLPTSVFAAGIVASGTCGNNLTWALDDAGTLTISGTGNMKNYSLQKVNDKYITTAPWGEYYDTIKSVVIEAGVTSIGSSAFDGCSSLASVTIGNSVTSVGDYAFYGCSSLKSVTIPDSVTSIGSSAFYECSSLASVTIPDSVTSIGDYAFYGCSSLASVTIGNSVTSIGYYAFFGCSSLASVTIGNSVTSIGELAFYNCSSLASVTIPNSVTSIGERAFRGCSSLASVTIPNSVTSIGSGAFYGCSSLASVTIPNSVTSVGDHAFTFCSSLASVTIPNSVTSIGKRAFSNCSSLESMTIPDSVTSIGGGAFANCRSLASVAIPDSVTSIGVYAFYGCSSLASVTIGNSVTSIGNYAFNACSKLKDAAFGGTKEEWEATGYTFPSYVRMHYSCKSLDGHYVPVEVKEPNCQSTGYIKYICSCGNEYTETLPKSHDYVFSKTVAPTCSEHGYDLLKCSKCGEEKKEYHDDELLQHSYVVSAVEPSCLVGGYKLHKCSVCGYSYKDELVQPLGHSETNAEAKAPTCTEAGHTAGTCCSRCGKIMSGMAEIAALGHDYKDGVCTVCGAKDPDYKPPVNPFVDVSESSVYYDAILWAYYHEPEQITSGFDATHFGPQNACTRAQVVTFLWRAAGCPEPTGDTSMFKDASSIAAPYQKAVAWAVEKGITTGYNDGTFRPNDSVTRAQFVTFLWRYEGRPDSSGSVAGFEDAADIAAPYRDAVTWAVEKGVTTGYGDDTFRPNATCTRWAVVLFMYRDMK